MKHVNVLQNTIKRNCQFFFHLPITHFNISVAISKQNIQSSDEVYGNTYAYESQKNR